MGPITEKYVVLNDAGITLEDSDDVYAKGAVLELDPANEQTARYLAGDFIAPVKEIAPEDLEDVVVTDEFLAANPDLAASGIVVGDTIKLPKETAASAVEHAGTEVAAGDATAGGTGDATATAIAEEVAQVAAPIEEMPAIPGNAPLAYTYQGMAVVSDGMRTVNDKKYHHVRLTDGSEHDLTEEEYSTMLAAVQ